MGNFTSSSKKPKASAGITELDRTILSLKTQRNRLNDQMKLLDKRVDRHKEVARELIKEGRKDRALLALKKKKMAMMQQEQVASHVLHVESMLSNIETSKQQTALFKVLLEGNEQLKAIQKLVTVEDVEKLMEDTAEAQAYQDELNRALGMSLSGVDDAAVEAEFDILEAEEAVATAASMPTAPTERPAEQQLPAVPTRPVETPAEEDEQLEGRQAMLAT